MSILVSFFLWITLSSIILSLSTRLSLLFSVSVSVFLSLYFFLSVSLSFGQSPFLSIILSLFVGLSLSPSLLAFHQVSISPSQWVSLENAMYVDTPTPMLTHNWVRSWAEADKTSTDEPQFDQIGLCDPLNQPQPRNSSPCNKTLNVNAKTKPN